MENEKKSPFLVPLTHSLKELANLEFETFSKHTPLFLALKAAEEAIEFQEALSAESSPSDIVLEFLDLSNCLAGLGFKPDGIRSIMTRTPLLSDVYLATIDEDGHNYYMFRCFYTWLGNSYRRGYQPYITARIWAEVLGHPILFAQECADDVLASSNQRALVKLFSTPADHRSQKDCAFKSPIKKYPR